MFLYASGGTQPRNRALFVGLIHFYHCHFHQQHQSSRSLWCPNSALWRTWLRRKQWNTTYFDGLGTWPHILVWSLWLGDFASSYKSNFLIPRQLANIFGFPSLDESTDCPLVQQFTAENPTEWAESSAPFIVITTYLIWQGQGFQRKGVGFCMRF